MRIEGIAVTPSLFLTDRDEGDADTIRRGGRAFVSTEANARQIMRDLGMDEDAIRRALRHADGALPLDVDPFGHERATPDGYGTD